MIWTEDAVRTGVIVRVWRHDLRGRDHAGGLPAAWVRELAARALPLGTAHLVDAGHNLVTATGLEMIAARMQGAFVGPLSHMAVGTGTTPPAAGDVALTAEVYRDVFTQVTTAPALLVLRNYLGPNAANGYRLTEAGLFNAAAGPSLYAHRLFDTPLDKTPDSAATLEWTIAWAAGDEAFAVLLRRAQRHLLT